MKETDISNIPPKNTFAAIVLIQFVCITVLLSGFFALKYISPKGFKKAEKWCCETILNEKDFQRMLEETKDEI